MISVLYLDDSKQDLWLAEKYISQLTDNLHLIQTTSAETALEQIRTTTIDCVVTDHSMPLVSGIDFYKELRKINTAVPCILLAGKENEQVRHDAKKHGFDALLIKASGAQFYQDLLQTIHSVIAE